MDVSLAHALFESSLSLQFGITKDDLRHILDLSPREWVVFAPLIVLTLWMGIYPSSFTSFFDASVGAMVQHHTAALAVTTKLAGILH